MTSYFGGNIFFLLQRRYLLQKKKHLGTSEKNGDSASKHTQKTEKHTYRIGNNHRKANTKLINATNILPGIHYDHILVNK